jgi:hypothetical protein
MTKEQLERGKELRDLQILTEETLEQLNWAREDRGAHLVLTVYRKVTKIPKDALEAVLDTLIKVHEEKLKQIEKEFNEL